MGAFIIMGRGKTAAVPIFLMIFPFSASAAGENSCVTCHSEQEGALLTPVTEWKESIHKDVGVGCSDCHGGNPDVMDGAMEPSAGFSGKPRPQVIPALCARCHADVKRMRQYNIRTDQYEEYKTSIHGRRLAQGDDLVATCASCHGAHGIRKKNDPLSRVYHARVPETCGACHADAGLMKPYGIPSDQLGKYKESYHGRILYGKIPGKNPALVPNCASCHGIHGASPPGVKEISFVCGNCHGNTADFFRSGPHYTAMVRSGKPKCIDCHGHHDNRFPSYDMFFGAGDRHCGSCHADGSPQYAVAERMGSAFISYEKSLTELETSLKGIEGWGRNLEDLYMDFNQARTVITEAGPMAHTLNAPAVTGKLSEGEKNLARLRVGIEAFQKELKGRKIVMAGAVGLILFIVVVLLALRSGGSGVRS